jgi:hypothetical protein
MTAGGLPDVRLRGRRTDRHIRAQNAELRRAGFELIEFNDHDHIGALASTDPVAPELSAALARAGW